MREEYYVLDECDLPLEGRDGNNRVFDQLPAARLVALNYALTIPGNKIKVVQLVHEVTAPVIKRDVPA